jgi:hypothetical protein
MLIANILKEMQEHGRWIDGRHPELHRGDPKLGVLRELPGKWSNAGKLQGHAWNLIALPFGTPGQLGDFRLLLNQANETLDFDLVDLGVPNRGASHKDQHLAALRYLQALDQVAAVDAASDGPAAVKVPATANTNDTPKGDTLPGPGVPPHSAVGIHREPGLFLHLANLAGIPTDLNAPGPDVGRLANIPHGDAVLAMGFDGNALPKPGAPDLTNPALKAAFDPLPIGLGTPDLDKNPYFAPYKHFRTNKFQGIFDPTDPLALLAPAVAGAFPGSKVLETTTFTVDSTVQGGIQNIPFVINQANATRVTATFWIEKVETPHHGIKYVLQYAQRVLLEFFPRVDGKPGLIQWPHISINTMVRH